MGGGSPGQNLTLRKKISLVSLDVSNLTTADIGLIKRNGITVALDDRVSPGRKNEKLRKHFSLIYYKLL